MRFHYLDNSNGTETLCGAPMPARYAQVGKVHNAPTAVVGVEAFERIDKRNRCIKCDKKLPFLKMKRQKAGERAVLIRLREEAFRHRRSNDDLELSMRAHEMVYGVPCGPVLSMVTNPRKFIEEMLHEAENYRPQDEPIAPSSFTGLDLVPLESDIKQESNPTGWLSPGEEEPPG